MSTPQYQYNKQHPAPALRTVKMPEAAGLPHDKDLEEVVLGAMMLEQGAEMEVLDILSEDSFYLTANSLVFKAIVQLSAAQKPIDIYTVVEQADKNGDLEAIGGAYYIATLTEKVGSAAHIEFHARLLQQKHIARELIRVSEDIRQKAYDPASDIDETLQDAERSIYGIANIGIKKTVATSDAVLSECVRRLEKASESGKPISGIPSTFNALDKMTNGFQPSDLIIVAGRPAMGKTAFILSMAKNIAQQGIPTLVFSLEMSKEQLMNRLISAETKIPGDKIRSGQLSMDDWMQFDHTIDNLQNMSLYIDDTAAISLLELRSKAMQMKQKQGVALVMVDYLQLMTTGDRYAKANREQEVAAIARGLKNIAKELDLPVVALSQLSRNTVSRSSGNLRPQLQDLRDSGEIEQAADIVTFVHRPEYYGIPETEDGEPTDGLAEIIIAKHRNGPTGIIKLAFDRRLAKFSNID